MPIGDLLAQISGDKSHATPNPSARRSPGPKRKAEDDLRGNGAKLSRPTQPPAYSGSRPYDPPRASDKASSSTPRPSATSIHSNKPTLSNKPSNGGLNKPAVASRAIDKTNGLKSKPASGSRPAAAPSASSGPPKVPPKKGSFAEIMARGQRAQAVMGQVGKIQHKAVAKSGSKKDHEEGRSDARTPSLKKSSKPLPRDRVANDVRKSRDGTPTTSKDPRDRRNGATEQTKKKAEVEGVKVKKSAVPATGYTGTARPLPGGNKKKNAPRGGALLDTRPAPRYGGSSRRSRYDEDEEEMDDFIEYDDEEDEGVGPRYDYNSDDSDDMEAGMDDIHEEELRAEHIGRREDIDQERLEKRLKAEKEERKRKFYESMKSRR